MFVRVVCRRVPPLQYLFYWRGQEVSCGLEDRVRGLRAKQLGRRYSAEAEKVAGWLPVRRPFLQTSHMMGGY